MPSQTWLLEGNTARLNLLGMRAAVNATQPARGLGSIAVNGHSWPDAQLLGISALALESVSVLLADWHVCGKDLFAVYETGPPDAARIDLCWSAADSSDGHPWLARIDLLASVRTDRLDWQPDITLQSRLRATRPTHLLDAAKARFHALAIGEAIVVEMVHPADFRRGAMQAEDRDGILYLRHRLFQPESLEIGVILRARACAMFLPGDVDASAVAKCYSDFAAADPPLGI